MKLNFLRPYGKLTVHYFSTSSLRVVKNVVAEREGLNLGKEILVFPIELNKWPQE